MGNYHILFYVPDTPTSTPTVVKLVVSEVKDKKFTAKINIQCDHLISNASISVGYDDSLVEFEKCETNDKAGAWQLTMPLQVSLYITM